MSFVNELEQPRQSSGRPRSRPPRPDQRSLRARRALALAVGVVALLGLVLLIKGCRDSARVESFKDYARNVDQMITQSNGESRSLFQLLSKSQGQTPVELQTAIDGYRTDAAGLVLRARGTGRPDELSKAQGYLVEVLELRRDGIGAVADQLPSALGSGTTQSQASSRIATAMQDFLASDVLFAQRLVPDLRGPLTKQGLLGSVTLPHGAFLRDVGWLDPSTAATRLQTLASGAQSGTERRVSIGTVTASPGGQTLQQGAPTQLTVSPNVSFSVQLSNEGAYTQHDVVVKLQVSGGASPIQVEQRVPSIDPGAQQNVTLPLAATPPTGQQLTVSVQLQPATGVKDSGTTQQSFPVTFAG